MAHRQRATWLPLGAKAPLLYLFHSPLSRRTLADRTDRADITAGVGAPARFDAAANIPLHSTAVSPLRFKV
jgi:hypothetical protein